MLAVTIQNIKKMKKIIALKGKGNSGKTTTIRKLYTKFIENKFEVVETNFNIAGGDFTAVFKINDKPIGMTSSGDTYDLVSGNLQKQVDANCEVCICACRSFDRSKKGTNKAISKFEDYESEFIKKSVETNVDKRDEVNSSDALKILNRINTLIN